MLNALRSQLRTLWTVLQHSFTRAETVQYPEQKPYLAPRYRGRIVLTKDPDGEERCVACNLCVDVCPVENCITMEELAPGMVDARTGKTVSDTHADWTSHPNNPAVHAAE